MSSLYPAVRSQTIAKTGLMAIGAMLFLAAARMDAAEQITTFAGGLSGSADGSGISAQFTNPAGIAVDAAGVLYVTDQSNFTIRQIATDGTVSTIAGSPGVSGSTDAAGSLARFNSPAGIAVDASGNLFVTDNLDHTIRKIVLSTGAVTTIAGTAGSAGSADGNGASARFDHPNGIAVDAAGNLYVADTGNHTIRLLTPGTPWVVTTLAGTAGVSGHADGLVLTQANFNSPKGITVDAGGTTVYVADTGNNTIRSISSGTVSTLAGDFSGTGSSDGTGSLALFDQPIGLALDGSGYLLVADSINQVIRKVTQAGVVSTIAGSAGVSGSTDGLALTQALFNGPVGIACTSAGVVSIVDQFNNAIRQGTFLPVPRITSSLAETTQVGASYTYNLTASGTSPTFSVTGLPPGLAVFSGSMITGTPTTVGRFDVAVTATDANGVGAATLVITVDSADGTPVIYSPTSAIGVVGTAFTYQIQASDNPGAYAVAGTLPAGLTYNAGTGLISGTPTTVGSSTVDLTADASAVVQLTITITAAGVTPTITSAVTAHGVVGTAFTYQTTASDSPISFSFTGTLPAGLTFSTSTGLISGTPTTVESQDVSLVATNLVGAGTPTTVTITITSTSLNQAVSTIAGQAGSSGNTNGAGPAASFSNPSGIAVDSLGNIYVADTSNRVIRQLAPPVGAGSWTVSTIAGLGTYGSNDGDGLTQATFGSPVGIACDSQDNLYVTDTGFHTIRMLVPSVSGVWTVSTIAGAGFAGHNDGFDAAAQFSSPNGIAVDDATGHLFVADTGNHCIREILPPLVNGGLWEVTTCAGSVGVPGNLDGDALTAALFDGPSGIAVDAAGIIYVADTNNHAIRTISAGVVVHLAGDGFGLVDGTVLAPQFNLPYSLAVDAVGNVFVADSGNNTLREISPAGVVTTLAGSASASGSTDGLNLAARFNFPVGIVLDAAGHALVTDQFNNTIRKVDLPPAPVITSALTASAGIGQSFSYLITADYSPTSFDATGLPSGLSITTSTGVITGIPDTIGVSNVTLTATSANGIGHATLVLTVTQPKPIISSALTASGVVGTPFTYQVTASDSPTSYTITGLPAGLSGSASTGLISGTPTAAGSSSVTISATNVNGAGDPATLVLTIAAAPPVTPPATSSGGGGGGGCGAGTATALLGLGLIALGLRRRR